MTGAEVVEDDAVLMERYYAGENVAFDGIRLRYFGRIVGWARKAGIPDADVDDIAAESLLHVVCTKGFGNRFDPAKGRFQAWIWMIARHCILDWFRRNGRFVPMLEDQGDECILHPAGGESDLPMRLSEAELKSALRHCYRLLGELDARIVYHRWVLELHYKEIARLLGSTESVVTNRLHNAKRRLGKCIEQYLATPGRGAQGC